MSLKRKYLDEVQYARALALFAVFAVHSSSTGVVATAGTDSIMFGVYNFLNIAGKLGTPTFIFLSSFILFYTYYHRDLTAKLFKQFYKKRLLFILVPYVVFSAFYFLIYTRMYGSFDNIPLLLENFLFKLATGNGHQHLYFVFVSVQFYLMFPILLFLFKKFKFIRKYSIFIGIAIQWIWVFLNSEFLQVPSKGSVSLSYFMFYFFGAFLGVYYEAAANWIRNWRKHFAGIALIFAAFAATIYFYVSIYYNIRTGQPTFGNYVVEFAWSTHALFAGATIFIVVHFLSLMKLNFTKKLLTELGTVSFGMYLIHPFFLMILRRIGPAGGEPIVFHSWQLITFLIAFFGSWIIVRFFFEFVPHSWIVFGKGNKLFNIQKIKKGVAPKSF
ncbi:acyltransferase [Planococcus shenhongbingii]|uniref:acyltransferase n=1 Tax=Planococcus shenhongbingii TaxID=3058398 RepID=UPI00260DCBF0|nr:acyltransferase [Planococcus sp. N016]WKA57838.1 acyltransferase [Planococcus sp. N016]